MFLFRQLNKGRKFSYIIWDSRKDRCKTSGRSNCEYQRNGWFFYIDNGKTTFKLELISDT